MYNYKKHILIYKLFHEEDIVYTSNTLEALKKEALLDSFSAHEFRYMAHGLVNIVFDLPYEFIAVKVRDRASVASLYYKTDKGNIYRCDIDKVVMRSKCRHNSQVVDYIIEGTESLHG